jgi:hypothetical protein
MSQEQVGGAGDASGRDPDGQPADAADGPPAVVEWGDTGAEPVTRAPRGVSQLWAEHRRAPVLAVVAGFALFGSLISDWRVWSVTGSETPPQQLEDGLVNYPVVGSAYLVGLFALVAAAGLALFGAGAVRRYARIVGLAVAAVLGAVLVMTVANMPHLGGSIEDFFLTPRVLDETGRPPTVEYGRGVYLAFAGVAAAALALYLVGVGGRGDAAGALGEPAAEPAAEPAGDPAGDPARAWAPQDGGDDWPWRPREARPTPHPTGPVDLTVEPAAPFLPPGETDGSR